MSQSRALAEFMFCPRCRNLLHPKEDRDSRLLLQACRFCSYDQVANYNATFFKKKVCTKVSIINASCRFNGVNHYDTIYTGELSLITSDVISDPTLPHTKDHPCPMCNHRDAVFFQGQTRKAMERFRLYYVCTNRKCTHKWTEPVEATEQTGASDDDN